MEIIEFTKPAPSNPYDKDVKALIAATRTNEKAAGAIEVPAKSERTERVKFQRAANEAGFTAKVVHTEFTDGETEEDGTAKIVFQLRAKINKSAKVEDELTEDK